MAWQELSFLLGVLLVLVLIGWYGSTLLTGGQWHTFTIVYAYWLTRRVIAIVISGGVLILIGTYEPKEMDNSMSVIPVVFSTEHKSMLEHCKMIS